jgi:hypothetical protein
MADELSKLVEELLADAGVSQVEPLPEDFQDNPGLVTLSVASEQEFFLLRQHFLRVAVQLIDGRHLDDEEIEKWNMKKMEACAGCNCLQESGCSVGVGGGVSQVCGSSKFNGLRSEGPCVYASLPAPSYVRRRTCVQEAYLEAG